MNARKIWNEDTKPRVSAAGPLTSADLVTVLHGAERRWFHSALRARVCERMRLLWKERFMARAVSLLALWRGRVRP